MVRDFAPTPVPPEVLERILDSARRGPSAGFSQGVDFVVLDDPTGLEAFWRIVDPRGRKRPRAGGRKRPRGELAPPPVVVVPVADPRRYLQRYSEADKRSLGMGSQDAWPVAYWELDAAMAVMLMLLAATDEGLGAWFFGLFGAEDALADHLGLPSGCRAVGAVALGHPAEQEIERGSPRRRARRPLAEVVHRGRW
jgi:nitroreductase